MPSPARIKEEGARITAALRLAKFETGIPLKRQFEGLSDDPGIYALKSETGQILYVGMASCFRTRFQGGHQTLVALYFDQVPSESVRIITEPLRGRWLDYMLQLEKIAIFTFQPPYNTRIPSVATITAMYTTAPKATPGHIKDILKYLPGNVVDALEDYADSHGMTDLQVIELAISGFLNLGSVKFEHLGDLTSVGALQERIAILETVLQKNGLTVPELPN
jgi:hypothetical protein